MVKVFISGALTSNNSIGFLENVRKMLQVDGELRKKGFITYCPCSDILSTLVCGVPTHNDFLKFDLEWLKSCDCLLLVPNKKNKKSKGVTGELKMAREMNIPIFKTVCSLERYYG